MNAIVNELEIRINHNGAIKKHGKYFCSMHTEIELTKDGECSKCIETDHIVASENAERQAQKAYDDALENDI